jgi:predicted permease
MTREPRIAGLRRLFRLAPSRRRIEREIEDELRFHMESRIADLTARGCSPDDARQIAEQEYGDVDASRAELVAVDQRAMARHRRADLLDILRQDLVYVVRGFRRQPGLVATISVTLALAVGANGAIFSLADPLFFRAPAGIAAPRELRRLYSSTPSAQAPGGQWVAMVFSYSDFRAIRAALAGSARVGAAVGRDSTGVVSRGDTLRAGVAFATADYLPLLGVRLQRGRIFSESEDDVNTPANVAIVGGRFARRAFGDSVDPLGRELRVLGKSYTIIGVTSPEFAGINLSTTDVWLPFSTNPRLLARSGKTWYQLGDVFIPLVARIAPGVDDRVIAERSAAAVGNTSGASPRRARSILLGPLSVARGPASRENEVLIVTRMTGVALLVLLIACANVANLLLARAIARRREIAVRLALGISRARLASQLLTESVTIALVAGAASVLIAAWAGGALRVALLPRVRWPAAPVGLRVLVFTMLITLVAGLLAGIVPAVLGSRWSIADALKAGARDASQHRGRVRAGLLIAQASLSVVLLVGAALFVKSLNNVRAVKMGYDVDQLVVGSLYFPDGKSHPEVKTLLPDVVSRIASMPGVAGAIVTDGAPVDSWIGIPLFRSGTGPDSLREVPRAPNFIGVPPEYFALTDTRIVAGRGFLATDRDGAPPVMVVGQGMARALWPGEAPIGKCLIPMTATNPCYTVVGVAEDVHEFQIVKREAETQYYLPLAQLPNPKWTPRAVVARAGSTSPELIAKRMREELRAAFPDAQPTANPVSRILAPQLLPWRLGAQLFAALSVLALIVSAIGVYGVVAFDVRQRLREMGIRIALGARTTDLVRHVVGQGTRVVSVGVVVGLLASLAAGKLVASLLYGVTPRDPASMGVAAVVLLSVAWLASLLPALRVSRVDPVAVLRED